MRWASERSCSAGVKQLAEAIPPPRSIESVATAITKLAKSRSPTKAAKRALTEFEPDTGNPCQHGIP